MNIETTQPRTTRRDIPNVSTDVLNPQQLGSRERDLRDKGARTTKNDEDDLYENVPCTD